MAGDAHPVLIAGGGIAGLSAAIALARAGVPVHLFEAAPDFAEVGAGLQIGPNGVRILQRWGLGDAVAADARRPARLVMRDGWSGQALASLSLGKAAETRYGAPYLVMTRQALHGHLLRAAKASPEVTITTGTRIAEWTPGTRRIAITTAGGRTVEGRALIAADGVHSALRDRLFRGARAVLSGRTAIRALAPLPRGGDEAASVSVWMAPNAHLVQYPVGAGADARLNLVAVLRDADLPGEVAPSVDEVTAIFRRWAFEAQLRLVAVESWSRWPLWTMAPLPQWSRGPVTLIGDAAHPVMPFLASGAVMAIEDAAVLAQEVRRSPDDCPAAFARYEQRRIPRIAQLQKAVARTGGIYHMEGLMRLARNTALGAMSERSLVARNDWLYGFNP